MSANYNGKGFIKLGPDGQDQDCGMLDSVQLQVFHRDPQGKPGSASKMVLSLMYLIHNTSFSSFLTNGSNKLERYITLSHKGFPVAKTLAYWANEGNEVL